MQAPFRHSRRARALPIRPGSRTPGFGVGVFGAWGACIASLCLAAACAGPGGAAASVSSTASVATADARPAAEDRAGDRAGDPAAAGAAGKAQADAPTLWTDAFAEKAVVVANHVRIEGPDGLLEHVVVSSDDVFFERTVTHEGNKLTQITERRGDEVPVIRAQLDQWQIAAFERITVVEHLEPRDVTVVATGEAALRDPLGKEERGEALRWVGTIPR